MPVIGREPPADIVIPLPTISSRHARIDQLPDGGYEIEDLGSSNGTYVNGRRIQTPTRVTAADGILLGSHEFSINKYKDEIAGLKAPQHRQAPPPAGPPPGPAAYQGQPGGFGPPGAMDQHGGFGPAAGPPPGAMAPQGGPPQPYAQVTGPDEKSYVGWAFLVWALYIFTAGLFGLIFNIVFLVDANKEKKRLGRSPSGYGCLLALLIVHVGGLLLGTLALALMLAFGAISSGALGGL